MDKFIIYHHVTTDAKVHQTRCNKFMVAKFILGLDESLLSICDQIVDNKNLPFLSRIITQVKHVSLASNFTFIIMSETSIKTAHGHGCGNSRGCGQADGCKVIPKALQCEHYGKTNHVSKKCQQMFRHPKWANNVIYNTKGVILIVKEVVTISKKEYEWLTCPLAFHSITTTLSVFAATIGQS